MSPASPKVRVEMLGNLTLTVESQSTARFRTRKTAALLAFLAFHPGRPHRREHLTEMLWPDKSGQAARHSLSMELSAVRKLLGCAEANLVCTNQTVELAGAATDVSEFERLLVSSESQAGDTALESLQQAWTLYNGPLLPGYEEEWVIGQQARLEGLFTACCERLTAIKQQQAGLFAAGEVAAKWVFVSPFDEGRRVVPERYVALAATEPSDDLPLMRSSVIGRHEECSEIQRLLRAGRQLVTVLGPGGVGKTTVALTVVQVLREEGRQVIIVRGAQVKRGESILASACLDLGLSTRDTPPAEQLALTIAQDTLLYLDNLEHLVEQSRPEIDELLRRRPDVQILATSRRPLRLTGEVEMRISPLAVPRPTMSTSEVLLTPSVQLFLQRCGAQSDDLVVAAGKLCAKLEGLPLAIELAAASAAAHLTRHVSSLAGQVVELSASDLAQSSSLEGAVKWSLDLLDAQERTLLGSLRLFKTSFSVEDVRLLGHERPEKAIAKLHGDSLIQERTGATLPRYRMLEPIREIVPSQLEPDELERSRLVFVGAMRLKAQRARQELVGPDQPRVLRALLREAPQFQSALDVCEEEGLWEVACTILCDLRRYWLVRHQFELPLMRIREVIRHLDSPELLAQAHFLAGRLLRKLQRLAEAHEHFEIGLHQARTAAAQVEEAGCLYGLGLLKHVERANQEALPLALASLEIFRELGNSEGIMLSAKLACYILNDLHDRPAAAAYLDEAAASVRAAGDLWGELQVMLVLGSFDRYGPKGRAAFERTFELATALGDRMSEAQAAANLATHLSLFGPFFEAFERFEAAERIYRTAGDWMNLAHTMVSRAQLLRRTGRAATAISLLEASEGVSRVAEGPVLWRNRHLRARCFLELDRVAEAVLEYELLLSEMPTGAASMAAITLEIDLVKAVLRQDAAEACRVLDEIERPSGGGANTWLVADLLRLVTRAGLCAFASDLAAEFVARAERVENLYSLAVSAEELVAK